jgi:ribosomal protein S21
MADFKRKPGESFESFLRKFKKGLKNSKRLEKARSVQHLIPEKTKRQQKKYALTSLKLKKEKDFLRKTGKLPEDEMRH